MAVSSAYEVSTEAGVDKKFNRTYTNKYHVYADKETGPISVLNAEGIPQWGSAYTWGSDNDLWSFVSGAKATEVATPAWDFDDGNGQVQAKKWLVTITYSTPDSSSGQGTRSKNDPRQNPLDDPPVISGSFLGGRRPVGRDKDDNALVTTAGDRYISPLPQPSVLDNTDTLQIQKNTATINLSQRSEYIGAVNDAELWGLPSRRILLARWDWRILYAGNMTYIQNNWEFHISYEEHPTTANGASVCTGSLDQIGWYTTLPNISSAPLTTASDLTTKRNYKDDQDMEITSPINIDCDGQADEANEHWNVFAIEKEKDFTAINGLPTTLPGPFVS